MGSGYAGHYCGHPVGLTHQFNDIVTIRREAGYYRNYTRPAFDLGTEQDMFMIGADRIFCF